MNAFSAAKGTLWIGAILSLSVGLVLYAATLRTIESDSDVRFRHMARNVQYAINARIKSYTDLLRGTASLFQADSNISRTQFQRYVAGLTLDRQFPGIQVINFARHISDAERPAFEQAMRAEMAAAGRANPPFAITPPGRRPSYTVLSYIEPESAALNKFGLDLEAKPQVALTLGQSRDTGQVSASGTRVAVLTGPNNHGLGMRLPVYRNDQPIGTVEQRRAAYIGSVGIGFGINRLIQGVLDEMPVQGVRLTLTEMSPLPIEPGEPKPNPVLYDSSATVADPTPAMANDDSRTFHTSLPIDFNSRQWRADFSIPKAKLYTRFDAFYPWLAMLAGVVSTALLYALFQALATSRRSAITIAQGMTKELRESQARLQVSHQTLRQLAAHADHIKEGERKRIAREIHDDLGQNLLALRIEADMLASRTRSRHPRLNARARATLQQIDATIKSVRQIINDLRPNVLDLGLNAAVDWQIAEFRRRTGVECELIDDGSDLSIDDHCATALFRILQESLSNISRHSHATKVRIELRVEGNYLTMSIADNGIGLPPDGRRKLGSFGLVGIEERVNILCGTFSIDTGALGGATVNVSVPLHIGPTAANGGPVTGAPRMANGATV